MNVDETAAVVAELEALRAEVRRLNDQRYFRNESSIYRVASWSMVRGLFFGLGSTLGATLLLALVLRLLGSIDFIPILGDWAQRIIEEVQMGAPQ